MIGDMKLIEFDWGLIDDDSNGRFYWFIPTVGNVEGIVEGRGIYWVVSMN